MGEAREARIEKWRIVVGDASWHLCGKIAYYSRGCFLASVSRSYRKARLPKRFYLEGTLATGSAGFPNFRSSAIVEEKNGVIITENGSIYHLGKPEHTGIRTFAEMRKAFPEVELGRWPVGLKTE